jgi:hypothetical protein
MLGIGDFGPGCNLEDRHRQLPCITRNVKRMHQKLCYPDRDVIARMLLVNRCGTDWNRYNQKVLDQIAAIRN